MATPEPPSTSTTTLNIPQLALLILVGVLAWRWVYPSPSDPSSSSSAIPSNNRSSRGAGQRVNLRDVDTIAAMFPQLGRREIMWDLQRNGGNVQMTTERILGGRGLETPPPSFQPILPESTQVAPSPNTTPARQAPGKPSGPDLIQRYRLDAKLSEAEGDENQTTMKTKWSNNKSERQSELQRRREEMILAARRKMMVKGDS